MQYFPIFVDLKGQDCLIVGGGVVAQRKAVLLNKAAAKITVVAPSISESLQTLVESSGGTYCAREFCDSDLGAYRLVIAATDNETVNAHISALAQSRDIPVNVVDTPEHCSFITPAIVERGPLTVAISSSGAAPVLARDLRAKIETLIPQSYGQLAALAETLRDKVKAVIPSEEARRTFWQKLFSGPVADAIFANRHAEAERLALAQLNAADQAPVGEVFLVGAGPGDPELLTLKALRLMQNADVVLYDRLVSDGVMELLRRDCERIYVGKRRADHAMDQVEINQRLVDLAKQGKKVLRLKGGDPFIFGRGGEEIELLAANNVPFQVVPGITAASGCAAYAGIPLTHRDYAQSVRFITGHLKNGTTNMNYSELVDSSQTLVFYMGLVGLPEICKGLITAGRSPKTPIALVEKGTTVDQRVLTSDLANMAALVEQEQPKAPTLLIVGGVVSLQHQLGWFKH